MTSFWHAESIFVEYLTLQECCHSCSGAETTAVGSDHGVRPEDFPLSSPASAPDQSLLSGSLIKHKCNLSSQVIKYTKNCTDTSPKHMLCQGQKFEQTKCGVVAGFGVCVTGFQLT